MAGGRGNEPGEPKGHPPVWWLAGLAAAIAVPAILLAVPGMASGRSAADVGVPPPVTPGQVSQGRNLFDEHCATCHGSNAQGTEQGPPIAGRGPAFYDFVMSTGRMPLDQPGVQAKRRPPVLTPGEISAITAYLTRLSPGGIPIPAVDARAGDLSLGEATFQSNCAPCHGATGNGGAVGPVVAPNLHEATALQIAEAIRIGPGTMPEFAPSTIDQQRLDSLVRYVLYLRAPEDPGGNGLNRVGPLIEGFVGLLFGLGLLVLMTRFIGTRTE